MVPVGRARAAVGSLVFLLLAPGIVVGVVPWLLTGWNVGDAFRLRIGGWMLIVAGLALLVHAYARFVVEGIGTPAPIAPPERLVVGGAYRYVRNPIYVALVLIIVGQELVLGRLVLLVYAVAVAATAAGFVRWYEEPTLSRRYGAAYDAYRRAVPAWIPRLRPYDAARRSPR